MSAPGEFIESMHGPRDERRDRETLAAMLGLPPKYALRAAKVLQLWEPAPRVAERPKITRPRDVFKRLGARLGPLKKEHLVGLYLDAQNGVIAEETISIGGLNTTRTHPREILYPAVTNLALGFILVHNHPSGSLDPSDEDVAFTRAVHKAGELLGIELYDHIIVARGGFTSLRERGAF